MKILSRTKSEQDDSWQISETDYPAEGTAEEQLEFLVGYAILAPSRFNRQPWSFSLRGSVLELRLDQTRLLPVTDSRGREAIMNCGTALYYLRVAMRYFGHAPVLEVLPDPLDTDLLACLQRGETSEPTEEEKAQFHAIHHRRTYERRFLPEPIPPELHPCLRDAASREQASLVFLDEHEERIVAANMVVEAEQLLQLNPDYRYEALEWGIENTGGLHLPSVFSQFWETFLPHKIDPDLILEAPALAVLGTESDTLYDWLAAGQALGAILLTADAASVQASFLNQPIEILSMRPRLQELVAGVVPQLIIRFGFIEGDYLPHTPRRSATDVPHLKDEKD